MPVGESAHNSLFVVSCRLLVERKKNVCMKELLKMCNYIFSVSNVVVLYLDFGWTEVLVFRNFM
jgi:uncharacterized membrane protein